MGWRPSPPRSAQNRHFTWPRARAAVLKETQITPDVIKMWRPTPNLIADPRRHTSDSRPIPLPYTVSPPAPNEPTARVADQPSASRSVAKIHPTSPKPPIHLQIHPLRAPRHRQSIRRECRRWRNRSTKPESPPRPQFRPIASAAPVPREPRATPVKATRWVSARSSSRGRWHGLYPAASSRTAPGPPRGANPRRCRDARRAGTPRRR